MKRTNIIIAVIGLVVLIVAISLFTRIGRTQSAVEDKTIQEKRNSILSLHQQGDNQAVILAAEQYLQSFPQDEEISIVLAENYMWSGKLDEAEKTIEEVLKFNSQSLWALRTLSAIYRAKAEETPELKIRFLVKAQLKIEEALNLASDDAWINIEAAQVYLAQGERYKALEAINKAIELNPEEEYCLSIKEQILSEIE